MKRFQLPIGVYLALVFLSGVLIGAFGLRLYMARAVSASVVHKEPSADEFRRRYLNEMQRKLGLDAAQVSGVNAVLDDTKARFREIHKQIEPEVKALKDGQVEKIRALLTPAQRPKYDEWRAARERNGK